MNLREKIKSYSFWVSLASAIILIMKILGTRFGFSVDETMISDLFTALCSILVLLGIIVVPNYNQTNNSKTKNEVTNDSINITQQNKTHLNDTNNQESSTPEIVEVFQNSNLSDNIIQNKDNESNITQDKQILDNTEINNMKVDNEIAENSQISNLSQIQEDILTETISTNVIAEDSLKLKDDQVENNSNQENNVSYLKTALEIEKKKFEGNLDAYIFELQEEIRKTREGV